MKSLTPAELLLGYGLLLESDTRLPSVAGLVAGTPIRGSWWGHPSGAVIYRVTNELAQRRDVALMKLISGKVTFVHRKFWPHLYAIGSAREPWQMERLLPEGRRLFDLVRKRGVVRTDDPTVTSLVAPHTPAATALDLERRLLVLGRQVHTQSGAHVKSLESWKRWSERERVTKRLNALQAKSELDRVVRHWNEQFDGAGRLPWWA
jgi:hypothetical protein